MKTNRRGFGKEIMDAKKITGILMAAALTALVAALAPAGTLALMEVGLVGLFYVVRRRRTSFEALRYGG
jgi:hypothetical protein